MKLVSHNTTEDLAALQHAKEVNEVETQLLRLIRLFVANAIRVVRGAGKPHHIKGQISELAELFEDYQELAGNSFSGDKIQFHLNHRVASLGDDEIEMAIEKMISGALQVAASRLANQTTHEHRGRSELIEGVNDRKRFIDNRDKPMKGRKPRRS